MDISEIMKISRSIFFFAAAASCSEAPQVPSDSTVAVLDVRADVTAQDGDQADSASADASLRNDASDLDAGVSR